MEAKKREDSQELEELGKQRLSCASLNRQKFIV